MPHGPSLQGWCVEWLLCPHRRLAAGTSNTGSHVPVSVRRKAEVWVSPPPLREPSGPTGGQALHHGGPDPLSLT